MATHPAAYLRRSYVDPDSPGDISKEVQRAAVRQLATADGHNGNLVEYDDWGISADVAKAAKRTAYTRLLADMEAGQVSAVYAFDDDRLYRDPRDLIRLQDAAEAHRVRIVTTGGVLAVDDDDDPAAEGFTFIKAVFGRMELRKAKKRNRAARDARKARGDQMGHPLYGFVHVRDATGRIVRAPNPAQPVEPIIAAYREAGTVLGACRLLNARGIPGSKGGTWHTSQLTRVLEVHAPELLPRRGASGQRIRASATLSQIIKCHCGKVMTPNTHRRQLYCSQGAVVPGHGRYTVQEKDVMPWIVTEAARLRLKESGRPIQQGSMEERREAISARLARYAELYAEGGESGISRERYSAEKVRANAELDALADELRLTAMVPKAIDWNQSPASVNQVLRSMWRWVELDEQMHPVRAEWVKPQWRRA